MRFQLNREEASLDVFWLRDESLEESDNLLDPDVFAREIVEDLEAALEQFREIAWDLGTDAPTKKIDRGGLILELPGHPPLPVNYCQGRFRGGHETRSCHRLWAMARATLGVERSPQVPLLGEF